MIVAGVSRQQACLCAGLGPDCIRSIERGAYPRLKSLQSLAAVLGVSVGYLTGEPAGDSEAASATFDAYPEPSPLAHGHLAETGEPFQPAGPRLRSYVLIQPVAGGGFLGSGAAPNEDAEPALFRRRLIRDELRGEPEDFAWAEIAGRGMAPALEDGTQVLIDTRATRPMEPALFAVDEGIGPVARWVEHVGGSDPPAYRIRCEDRRRTSYEIAADRIRIIGRIVWLGRRL